MTPDQFCRVRALFKELHGLPASEWAARLQTVCPDDPAVGQEVLDLLQQTAADRAAQRTVPGGGPRTESSPTADPLLGTSIRPYGIRGVLGQGGMGTVYEAEHERTKQVVALKLIRPGLATAALLRRFEFELQVLARLEHPGIARIYHADTAAIGGGPQPYFAMELVRGQNLIQYATEQKLTIRQRLELAAKIADAVQYAHQQGVIHRDLKPGNIFVTSEGQPKILDFGVARATDSNVQSTMLQTDIGQLIGTLPYMSPEQAGGDPNQIDTRSDVYALGVVIYELLTGQLPYLLERRLIHEVVRIIKEEEPTRLSSLNRTLRGDVETIVGKALEKEKERRYASANALAADIRRYLNDEPIAARPPSAGYELAKFAKRNQALVGGVGTTLVALVLGLAGTAWQAIEAASQRNAAEQQRDKATAVVGFLEHMLSGVEPAVALGLDTSLIKKLLDEARQRIDDGALAQIPEAELQLRVTVAEMYREIAEYQAAEAVIEPAVVTVQAVGAAHPKYAQTMNQYGLLKMELGCWFDALGHFEAAVASHKQGAGASDSQDVAAYVQNLGWCLDRLGLSTDGLVYLDRALEMRRHVNDDCHYRVARALRGVADCQLALANYYAAISSYEESLNIYIAIYGEHPYMVETYVGLSRCFAALDQSQNAALFKERASQLTRQYLPKRPEALACRIFEAEKLLSRGAFVEAIACYKDVLDERRRVFGRKDHPDIAATLSDIGACYRKMGQHKQDALVAYDESLSMLRRLFPNGHALVAKALHGLSHVEYSDNAPQAQLLLEEALAIYERIYCGVHPDTATTHFSLAEVCLVNEDEVLAHWHAQQALHIRQQVFSNDAHSRVIVSKQQLCRMACWRASRLLSLNLPADALAFCQEAVQVGSSVLPPSDIVMQRAFSQLVETHILLGQREMAEEAICELAALLGDDNMTVQELKAKLLQERDAR